MDNEVCWEKGDGRCNARPRHYIPEPGRSGPWIHYAADSESPEFLLSLLLSVG